MRETALELGMTQRMFELQLDLHLLGGAEVKTLSGWQQLAPDKPYFLLAYLAVKQDWVSREHLADLFWSDMPSSSARRNLRKILFKIRSFGWVTLEESVAGLRWQIDADVIQFQEACAKANWQKALRSYRGVLLEGLEVKGSTAFAEWLELERMRLNQLHLEAKTQYAAELEAKGEFEAALKLMRSSLQDDPLSEASHLSIMRLEHKRGNTEAAFEQFELLRLTLKRELGVEPLAETVAFLTELEQGGSAQGKPALLLTQASSVPDRPERLVGRETVLNEAKKILEMQSVLLLQGFGGMGKTALAAELTAEHLQKGGKALWLELGSDNPETVFDALAQPFGAQQALAKAQDKGEFLKTLFLNHKISLLVLDDVWSAYSLSKVCEALPKKVSLLLTSRQRYPRFKRLSLGRLDRVAALELLSLHAGRSLAEKEADTLCQLLGDHAFALRMAGLTLRESQLEPRKLIEQLKNAPHDLKVPPDFAEEGRHSVAFLLSVSLQTLADLEYESFLTFGALPSPSASAELIALCLRRSAEEVEDALFVLSQRGLAERQSQAGSDLVTYRIHDLAHSYARANRFQRPISFIAAGAQYLTRHKTELPHLARELPNVLGAAEIARDQKQEEVFVEMMSQLSLDSGYYTARGHSKRSLELLKDSAEIAQTRGWLKVSHQLLSKLGEYYLNFAGNNDLALHYYERANRLAEREGDKQRSAILLGLIGLLRFQQGERDFSDYLDKAQHLATALGEEASLSRILDQKSYIAAAQNDWQEANAYSKASLEALEALVKTSELNAELEQSLFFVLLNLGETEFKLGNVNQGLERRERALALARKAQNQVWMAMALTELGEMHHLQGQRQEAKEKLLLALTYFHENHAQKDVTRIKTLLLEANYCQRVELEPFG